MVVIGLISREGACFGAAEPLLEGAKEITFFAAPTAVQLLARRLLQARIRRTAAISGQAVRVAATIGSGRSGEIAGSI